jgi:homoserine acetyltransferase
MSNVLLFAFVSILEIESKILIFHSEDDWLISRDRSRELVRICEEKRSKQYSPVSLIELHSDHRLGHSNIGSHNEIYPIVK